MLTTVSNKALLSCFLSSIRFFRYAPTLFPHIRTVHINFFLGLSYKYLRKVQRVFLHFKRFVCYKKMHHTKWKPCWQKQYRTGIRCNLFPGRGTHQYTTVTAININNYSFNCAHAFICKPLQFADLQLWT